MGARYIGQLFLSAQRAIFQLLQALFLLLDALLDLGLRVVHFSLNLLELQRDVKNRKGSKSNHTLVSAS